MTTVENLTGKEMLPESMHDLALILGHFLPSDGYFTVLGVARPR